MTNGPVTTGKEVVKFAIEELRPAILSDLTDSPPPTTAPDDDSGGFLSESAAIFVIMWVLSSVLLQSIS